MTLTPKRLTILGIVVAVVVGYILVEALWVTDKEKLHRLVSNLEQAVEAQDAEACVALVDEESWDWLGTRAELVALLDRLFATYDPVQVRVVREEVQAEPPRGTARVLTIVVLGPRSPWPGPVNNTWMLTCTKRNGRWLISRARVTLQDGSEETVQTLVTRAARQQ